LKAEIFGRIERDGYTVEKVYIQTYPGFYLAGNLYRPLGQGDGPFPGILNPHGHWKEGRLEDSAVGSVAARCINFARQGMVAFSYDMVGYNDTAQVNHKFASSPTNLLWNISLMGLQTWNSIRALDFLASLPDVDKKRLACTGASGGGTQTFMLGAIEDRLAAQAPNVMVSHSMQGGCLCENAPGLRVDYSNMEIAAAPAPRPQILVAATGDWTRTTMTIEGPSVESIYRLLRAPEKLRYVIYDFDHNYNQTSREAVYGWFAHWLQRRSESGPLQELSYQKEPNAALLVWPDKKLPADALTEGELIAQMIERSQGQWRSLQPSDKRSLEEYRKLLFPAWRHTLQVELPERGVLVEAGEVKNLEEGTLSRLHVGRAERGDRIPAVLLTPPQDEYAFVVVLADPEGKRAYLEGGSTPKGLARQLLDRHHSVLLLDTFLTGEMANDSARQARNPFSNFFCTYNRTEVQERVQDLITACAFAHRHEKGRRVALYGAGRAGLWAMLAAPAADVVVADCDALDLSRDDAIMGQDLFVPGLRKMGGFEGAASLAAPHPLLLYNVGSNFPTAHLRATYAAAKAAAKFREEPKAIAENAALDWLDGWKGR
jgi:dienelactone hydrolase